MATSPFPSRLSTAWLSMLLLLLVGARCDTTAATVVEVRVVNDSSVDFTAVELGFTDLTQPLGRVEAGGASDYAPFETAYRYGYVRVATADGPRVLQPIDYVGEEPLAAGRYTFRLDVEGQGLSLVFVAD